MGELADGQELEHALLDLLQAVVALVQDPRRLLQVLQLAAALLPRHRHQPVDVVPRHGRLGRHRRHRLEPPQLLLRLLAHQLRGARLLDLLLQLGDLVAALVLAPELVVNRLDLLVEVVLLLSLLHLLLDLHVDPLVDVDLLDLDIEQVVHGLQAFVRIQRLEQRLLLGRRHGQVSGQGVGEAVGIVELQRRHQALEGQVMGHLRVLLEAVEQAAHVDLDLVVSRVVDLVDLDLRLEGVVDLFERPQLGPPQSLDHHLHVAVRQLDVLHHPSDDTDPVDVVDPRVVDLRIALGDQEDQLAGRAQRLFQREHGTAPADDEGRHHLREDHHVPQRHDRQPVARGRNVSGGHPYPAFSYTVSG